MTITVTTTSADETKALGRRLAPLLTAGDIVVLAGRLGAGKTLFVSGVAEGLGISGRVTSPSFVIARTYTDGFLPLVHVDVYRLGSLAEFDDLDLVDDGAEGAVIIEWGEAIVDALPSDRLTVTLEMAGDHRSISFEPEGAWCDRDLAVLA
jgi:tRNA threonylcarbamoyladenosine biosynthesis protein TsaE